MYVKGRCSAIKESVPFLHAFSFLWYIYLYRRYAAPLMGGAAFYAYQSSYIPCFIDKHYPLYFMLHVRHIAWSQVKAARVYRAFYLTESPVYT